MFIPRAISGVKVTFKTVEVTFEVIRCVAPTVGALMQSSGRHPPRDAHEERRGLKAPSLRERRKICESAIWEMPNAPPMISRAQVGAEPGPRTMHRR